MKISLVKFTDEQWAIKKHGGFFRTRYVDLTAPQYAWGRGDAYFSDSLGSEERARAVFERITASETIIETRTF